MRPLWCASQTCLHCLIPGIFLLLHQLFYDWGCRGDALPDTSRDSCLQSMITHAANVSQLCESGSLSGVFPRSVTLALNALELPLHRAQLQHSRIRSVA